ncbi:acyltransferase family protein [Methylomonas koyamae]|uniref:acyltransferase family protein n=1 Tax=Methylomonas koyamae TaxID=702114 RepID=UPI0006D0D426|nr:acyltransferase [Methylomonas koyamae]
MTSANPHLLHIKYRPDIDGLRAVAVLSVVVFHAFPNGLKGGFIGVDIFFVISGYLISSIIFQNLEKGTFSFGEFYARRVKRIFPSLILVLAASYAFGWFALFADEYKELGKHIAAGAASSPTLYCGAKTVISIIRRKPSRCCIYGAWESRNNFISFGPS